MSLLLSELGANHLLFVQERLRWLVEEAADCLSSTALVCTESHESKLKDAFDQALPHFGDARFSPLWIAIMDTMFRMSDTTDMSSLYDRLKRSVWEKMLKGEPVFLPVVLHLWLTNLPSLEFTIFNLVQHQALASTSGSALSMTSANMPSHSLLVQAACHEPAISKIIERMLVSLQQNAELASAADWLLKSLKSEIRDNATFLHTKG